MEEKIEIKNLTSPVGAAAPSPIARSSFLVASRPQLALASCTATQRFSLSPSSSLPCPPLLPSPFSFLFLSFSLAATLLFVPAPVPISASFFSHSEPLPLSRFPLSLSLSPSLPLSLSLNLSPSLSQIKRRNEKQLSTSCWSPHGKHRTFFRVESTTILDIQ
ncbi:hypothetical protein B9Z19DRAFT_578784 [Tuber borchii]|uniref:Uncharacterized protein n=1 Tax=Tuber borchii TaxID=42251 RepID=A0A2T6ZCD4_TUBBO|nr:hypothetical protein B9Z19DRAFT_578784 [Tuber borchii]